MPTKLPNLISREEFESLLKAMPKQNLPAKLRKQYSLAMLLMFEAGMRISEVFGYRDRVPRLTRQQIEGNHIRILSGKGKKDRIVPRPKRVNNNAIKLLPLKINRRTFQKFMKKLGQDVLGKKVTPHTLRHGFATHYYNQTKDLIGLQMLLGHARLDTTRVYTQVNPQETIEKALGVFE